MTEHELPDALSLQKVMGLDQQQIPEDETTFIAAMAERIGSMLAENPEYLMSFLYRFDVAESKIRRAMHPSAEDPADVGLAKLVYERYKQRLETKKQIKPGKMPEGMEDWEW